MLNLTSEERKFITNSGYNPDAIDSKELEGFRAEEGFPNVVLDNNDGQVNSINENPAVISSNDTALGFKEDSAKTDELLNPILDPNTLPPEDTTAPLPPAPTAGDNEYTELEKQLEAEQVASDARMEAEKTEYRKLFETSMANLSATNRALVERINSTFESSLEEQKRINQVSVDRRKGFGLSTKTSLYAPIMMSDSITEQQRIGAEKITKIESDRDRLLIEAKNAMDTGQAGLLRQKLEDISNLEADYAVQMRQIESDMQERLKLQRSVRQQDELEYQQAITKAIEDFTRIADLYGDEFGELDDEGKEAFIQEKMRETGLSYAEIASILHNTQKVDYKEQKAESDAEKAELQVDKEKHLVEGARLKNVETGVDIENKLKDNEEAEVKDATPAQIQKEIPDTFTSYEEAEAKYQELVKKYGSTKLVKEWNARFPKDDQGERDYTIKSGGGTSNEADDYLTELGL